jgi:starvation-inducible DNA-binding protein
LYEAISKTLDEVAEILKMKGECPLVSLNEYLSNTTIEELKCKEVKSDTAFKIVLTDFKELKQNCKEIRDLSIEEDEYEIITFIEDNLKEFNKSIWFIESSLK